MSLGCHVMSRDANVYIYVKLRAKGKWWERGKVDM